MTPTAYVDESEPGDRRDPGAYILAAAIPAVDAHDLVRGELRALKPRSARKLHWTESDAAHRQRIATALAALPLTFVAAVAILPPTSRSERRRRVALERLLFELLAVGIDSVVLESRGPADRHDRAHVDALRARRMIGSVRVDHVAGTADPLLWAADAACGLIAQDRREESARRGLFDDRMVVHEVRR